MAEPTRDSQAIALIGLYRSYRDAGVEAWLATRGVSMTPLSGPGGRMLVEFGARPTRIGEIVVFERQGRIVAHRLVGTRRRSGVEQLIVKGDAEAYFYLPIGRDDVLGVVRASARRARSRPSPGPRRPLGAAHRERLALDRSRRPTGASRRRPFTRTHPPDRAARDPGPRPGPDPADHGTHHPEHRCGREVIRMEYG